MNQSTLTHIVPALLPQIDGVGDYALNLARHLRQSHGVESRFIVCDPSWDGPALIEGFPVKRLRMRNEAGLWNLLSSAKEHPAALLHYVGYGYHNRGVPLWLYQGIKSWLAEPGGRHAHGRKQFSTVFHELWASGKPWKSAFYLQPLQRWLVDRLHRLSVVSITSTWRMQQALDQIQPNKTIRLPIPSNVPLIEQQNRPVRHTGRLRVAIFGQPWSRAYSVRRHSNLLRTLQEKDLLESALVIGKGLGAGHPKTEDVSLLEQCVGRDHVRIIGEMSAASVAKTLSEADLFVSHYQAELACKSGAFMAALATGCPAVLRDGHNAAPLSEGEHFVASDDSAPSVERLAGMAVNGELPAIAASARSWYQQHADWKVVARQFQQTLCPDRHATNGEHKQDSLLRAARSLQPA